MRLLLSLLLSIFSIFTQAQDNLYVGKVVADKNFNCNNYSFLDPLYGSLDFVDSLYGIKNICQSSNEVEIRFTTQYAPTPRFDIVILSYSKNDGWNARKFKFNVDTLYNDSATNAQTGKIIVSKLKIHKGPDNLLHSLIKNDVFELPDINEVKNRPNGPKDGLNYSLSFKVQNNFRTYKFANTQYYIKHSKKKVFRKYDAIFRILSKELYENDYR